MGDKAQEASQDDTTEETTEVTDEMLDRAAEGVEEEIVEETVETEGETATELSEADEDVPDEPEDNAERSRLGRKVQELENELLSSKQQNSQIVETLDRMNTFLGKKEEGEESEFLEMPETSEELTQMFDKYTEDRERKKASQTTQAQTDYQSLYVDTVMELLEGDTDADKKAVLEAMDKEFNIKHSKTDSALSGVKDAAKNVMNARKSMVSPDKSIPVKGGTARSPLGGGGGDKTLAKGKKAVRVDAATLQLQKDLKLPDDYVQDALS